MGLRLTQVPQDNNTGENTDPIGFETTYDGQTFFWAPGEKRVFGDDGQAIGHSNNSGAGSPDAGVVVDDSLSTKKYPDTNDRT